MIKKVRKAIDAGDKDVAATTYTSAQRRIDSIADKKIIHKNTAARQKSKLSRAIKSMG
jgi:small subunit ribosomal protein S20